MWTTLICIFSGCVLIFGMSVPDSVSYHMQQSPWFSLSLSLSVVTISLINSHVQPAWTSNLLSLTALCAWIGILLFDRSHPHHSYFVTIFSIAVALWVYLSNANLKWLWLGILLTTGIIWIALWSADVQSAWIVEYMVFWVYGGFWWYWMTYDIRDPLYFYVCAAEPGTGNIDPRMGQQA